VVTRRRRAAQRRQLEIFVHEKIPRGLGRFSFSKAWRVVSGGEARNVRRKMISLSLSPAKKQPTSAPWPTDGRSANQPTNLLRAKKFKHIIDQTPTHPFLSSSRSVWSHKYDKYDFVSKTLQICMRLKKITKHKYHDVLQKL
jgi:hypothetical protein